MEPLSQYLDGLSKLLRSAEFSAFCAITSFALLLMLSLFPQAIGVSDIPSVWRAVLAIVFNCSVAALVIHVVKSWRRSQASRKRLREQKEHTVAELAGLSVKEAACLIYAHQNGSATITLPFNSATASSLMAKNLINYQGQHAHVLTTNFIIESHAREELGPFASELERQQEEWAMVNEIQRDYRRYLSQPAFHYRDW